MPNGYSVRRDSEISKLEEKAVAMDRLETLLSHKKCCFTDDAKAFVAAAMAEVPAASQRGMEQAFPALVAGLFTAAKIPFDPELLAKSLPSAKTLGNLVIESAADALMRLADELEKAEAIFLADDKGNRKNVDHLPKAWSFYSEELDRVVRRMSDVGGTGASSAATAQAIKDTLVNKLRIPDDKINGRHGDNGGGGTGESGAKELEELDLTDLHFFVWTTCSLHALQCAYGNAVKDVFGEGGIGIRNILQLAHSVFDLQNYLSKEERDLVWAVTLSRFSEESGLELEELSVEELRQLFIELDEIPDKITKAVLTRWWYVSKAVEYLLRHWDAIFEFASVIINSHQANSKKGKVASSIYSLMQEPMIRCHAEFIQAFSASVLHQHFKWMQGVDKLAKEYGFRSRSMLERIFLVLDDVEKLSNGGWREDLRYQSFLQCCSEFPETLDDPSEAAPSSAVMNQQGERKTRFTRAEAEAVADSFFSVFSKSYEKQSIHWVADGNVAMYALGGEQRAASALAQYSLDGTIPADDELETDPLHPLSEHGDRTINVRRYIEFISARIHHMDLQCTVVFKEYEDEIRLIASGASVWDIESTRWWYKRYCLPCPSNNQAVEAMVGEASRVATTGRTEEMRNAYAILRNSVTMEVNRRTREVTAGRLKRNNGHMEAGKTGERATKSSKSKRKHGAVEAEDAGEATQRGSVRAECLIRTVVHNNKMAAAIPNRKERRTEHIEGFRESSYSSTRVLREAERIREANQEDDEDKPLNAAQQETGVDITGLMNGKLPVKLVRAEEKDQFVQEIRVHFNLFKARGGLETLSAEDRATVSTGTDRTACRASSAIKFQELKQMMKIVAGGSCFTPLTDFFADADTISMVLDRAHNVK